MKEMISIKGMHQFSEFTYLDKLTETVVIGHNAVKNKIFFLKNP